MGHRGIKMGVRVGHRWLMAAFALFLFLGVSVAQETVPASSEQNQLPHPSNGSLDGARPQTPTDQAQTSTEKLTKKEISPEELRDLVRRAMENDQENYRKQKDLTHIERQKIEHLDGDGKLKKTEIVTREILILYGDRMERVIERDDKPLSPEEKRKKRTRSSIRKSGNCRRSRPTNAKADREVRGAEQERARVRTGSSEGLRLQAGRRGDGEWPARLRRKRRATQRLSSEQP